MKTMVRKRSARTLWFGLILMLLSGPGCGDSRIIVTVDIESFLSDADKSPAYGPVPPLPVLVSVRIGPNSVQGPEGLGDLAEIEDADLKVRAVVNNLTGTGTLDFRVFFAAPAVDPFVQVPAGVFQVALNPNESVIIEETIELTAAIQTLFTESELVFAYELLLDASQSATAVEGAVSVEVLTVRVVHNPNLGS